MNDFRLPTDDFRLVKLQLVEPQFVSSVMKKKNPPKTEQPRPAPRLTRQEAREAVRLSEEQREAREVFRERMKNAPQQVRVRPVRTRGYYRFAKEYPSDVGADGFRENRPPAQKLSRWGKALAALLCVVAFCLAFIGTKTAMLISAQPGDTAPLATPSDADDTRTIRALRFTAEELDDHSPDELKRKLDEAGCNVALFEYKNEAGELLFSSDASETDRDDAYDEDINYDVYGYYDEDGYYHDYDEYEEYGYYDDDGYYHPYDDEDSENENESGAAVNGAWKTVNELEEMGIRTAAYISCFRDSAAVAENDQWAVRDFDDPDEPLYDVNGGKWLDPYLPETTAYLTGLIKEAIDGGFSYVVLDNVCFPCDLGLRTAYFRDADVADQGDNSILLDFLADALGVSGSGQLVVMCDVNGITAGDGDRDNRYGGSLLSCGAALFAVDARLSLQPSDQPDPLGVFAYKDTVPTAFILSACNESYYAVKNAEHVDARLLACAERGDDLSAVTDLLSHTGLNDYIIW